MKTLYQLKHLTILTVGWSIAILSTAIAVSWLAPSGKTIPGATAVAVTPSSVPLCPAALVANIRALDDYQPPDNGGPSKTGGSGTRWRTSDAIRLA